ncbi:molybdopterin converting factor subunit 1 [Notoacmeibacter sp. MSK16QG-6]|uniref:molybdopterin converting factor subunit 1 n=1 Tax=Notoacmeibacter sp. MSK16QG-6 TaxID=2957982 RepID=UPI00209D1907|nr:molybdopterin converting factor subunit 1 [Notoacmeibacter sp. MSK16QG-6]MCP1197964.1 molybdopterin converting factor subunit 1 [Notoacmeibacter sp. MSK16QG-6]
MVKLVYFAWVRERLNKSSEEIELPETVETVGDLLDHLAERGDAYADLMSHRNTIRVAIDQEHADRSERIGNASEIALFPPMTGG